MEGVVRANVSGLKKSRNVIGLKTFLPGGWQKDCKTEQVQLVCNAYGYDRNGNRTFKETISGRTEYEYDSRNRLEMVRYPDRWEKFGYDLAGNRKSRVTGEGEENYTYDVRNRLLQVVRTAGNGAPMMAEGVPAGSILDGSGSAEHETARETKNINMSSDNMKWKGNWQISKEEVWKYEYDRQGNLLKDNHAEYSYDGFNRMEKAETFTGKIQVNHYDAEGLRHEMEENGRLVSFIFSAREVVAEREKESTIRYIRGYDIVCSDSECARMYYHYVCDEGGSTSHVLDETGKVLNQYEYDAFGNLIKVQEEVNNRFLYVGQQYDAVTMQYYLRARYYNPVVARFTQEDTYRGDGLNLYAYCRNNPVGYYDPSGYDSCPNKGGKIIGPNGTQITPEYDKLVYGGYYGRKDERRQNYSNNGIYNKADYHGKKDNPIKSKAPKNGKKALGNSVPIGTNTKRRVGISDGEIVVFDNTRDEEFHAHVRPWKKLSNQMKAALKKAGMVNKKGKIIK